MNIGKYPQRRMRRNRLKSFSRELLKENNLAVSKLIYPMFVIDHPTHSQNIDAMPDQKRLGIEPLIRKAAECVEFGIPAVALFPWTSVEKKSFDAKEAYNPDGIIPKGIKAIKKRFPELGVISDVALDTYTNHGHDGIIDAMGNVLNDDSILVLKKQALCHAQAGADIVAPSDMMDGRVKEIRSYLDDNSLFDTQILSYAVKYASNFYSPFRDAVGSSSQLKTEGKHTYQMDYSNGNEAIMEARLDVEEGADMLMVKPAGYYCDIIFRLKKEFMLPIFSYHVSGEYSMVKAASKKGWLDEKRCVQEILLSLVRAGSSAIMTYYALQVAKWLKEGAFADNYFK
jgi:porphobilinogen synthase